MKARIGKAPAALNKLWKTKVTQRIKLRIFNQMSSHFCCMCAKLGMHHRLVLYANPGFFFYQQVSKKASENEMDR